MFPRAPITDKRMFKKMSGAIFEIKIKNKFGFLDM